MNKALNYLTLSLQYLPFVLAGVQSVEAAVGNTADGRTKKQIFLMSVEAASKVGEQVPEDHIKLISALADSIVGQLNASGIFTHKSAPVLTSTAVAK